VLWGTAGSHLWLYHPAGVYVYFIHSFIALFGISVNYFCYVPASFPIK
jgi:hypothetical protein